MTRDRLTAPSLKLKDFGHEKFGAFPWSPPPFVPLGATTVSEVISDADPEWFIQMVLLARRGDMTGVEVSLNSKELVNRIMKHLAIEEQDIHIDTSAVVVQVL